MRVLSQDQPRFLLNATEGQGAAAASPPAATPSTTPSSAGGESSAPSVATPTPSAPSVPSDDEAFDFGSVMSEPNEAGVEVAPVVAAPTAPAATPAPAPAAPAAPAAAPAPAQAAPVAPAQPAAAAPGPQEQARGEAAAPPLSPAEPAAIAAAMAAEQQAMITQLAQGAFALSQQEQEELETNAIAAIPKLQAKAHVLALQSVMTLLSKTVPAMINQHREVQVRHDENEGKFYSRWPLLNKAQHGLMVREMAANYRKLHPGATLDAMIEDLGPFAMMRAKIAPGALTPPAAQSGAPHANGRPPQPSPFQPAGTGASAPIPTAVPDENPWGALDPANQG